MYLKNLIPHSLFRLLATSKSIDSLQTIPWQYRHFIASFSISFAGSSTSWQSETTDSWPISHRLYIDRYIGAQNKSYWPRDDRFSWPTLDRYVDRVSTEYRPTCRSTYRPILGRQHDPMFSFFFFTKWRLVRSDHAGTHLSVPVVIPHILKMLHTTIFSVVGNSLRVALIPFRSYLAHRNRPERQDARMSGVQQEMIEFTFLVEVLCLR